MIWSDRATLRGLAVHREAGSVSGFFDIRREPGTGGSGHPPARPLRENTTLSENIRNIFEKALLQFCNHFPLGVGGPYAREGRNPLHRHMQA